MKVMIDRVLIQDDTQIVSIAPATVRWRNLTVPLSAMHLRYRIQPAPSVGGTSITSRRIDGAMLGLNYTFCIVFPDSKS